LRLKLTALVLAVLSLGAAAGYRLPVALAPQRAAAHHELGLGLEWTCDLRSAFNQAAQADPSRPGVRADYDRLERRLNS